MSGIKVEENNLQAQNPVKKLPFVVKAPEGGWKNKKKKKYSRIVNGYYYNNPTKWKKKKDTLLSNLERCGKDVEFCKILLGEMNPDKVFIVESTLYKVDD